ncbi:MAG: hypothetical protein IH946_09210 [Bacteroidetes bacterium]|nr:hypothetical protein [Bacteroidota bacterium]
MLRSSGINLEKGIIPTGNPELDDIINRYQFDSVNNVLSNQGSETIVLVSNLDLNMHPIVKEMEELGPILNADFFDGHFDGNNIRLKRFPKHSILTFSIGRGDCSLGCFYHRYWEFRIAGNIAEFVIGLDNY